MNENNLAKLLLYLLNKAKSQEGYVQGYSSVGVRLFLREGEDSGEWAENDAGEPVYRALVLGIETDGKPYNRYGFVLLDPKLLEHMGDQAHHEVGSMIDAKSRVMLRMKADG